MKTQEFFGDMSNLILHDGDVKYITINFGLSILNRLFWTIHTSGKHLNKMNFYHFNIVSFYLSTLEVNTWMRSTSTFFCYFIFGAIYCYCDRSIHDSN